MANNSDKFLLDTSTFLWLALNNPKLTTKIKQIFINHPENIYISVISIWEITIKYQKDKLDLHQKPKELLQDKINELQLKVLSVDINSVFILQNLPPIHQDPFDRMLICQAQAENMTILTPDPYIARYNVKTLW